jgi:hypothetical protein
MTYWKKTNRKNWERGRKGKMKGKGIGDKIWYNFGGGWSWKE